MNYTILAIAALVMAIVAVAVIFRELRKSDYIYLKGRNDDIGDEAWRLIQKQELRKSYISKLAGEKMGLIIIVGIVSFIAGFVTCYLYEHL